MTDAPSVIVPPQRDGAAPGRGETGSTTARNLPLQRQHTRAGLVAMREPHQAALAGPMERD
jgi:hypothetical protein